MIEAVETFQFRPRFHCDHYDPARIHQGNPLRPSKTERGTDSGTDSRLLPTRLPLLRVGETDDKCFDASAVSGWNTTPPEASRIIADTLAAGLIKPFDPDQGKKYASYLPFWA